MVLFFIIIVYWAFAPWVLYNIGYSKSSHHCLCLGDKLISAHGPRPEIENLNQINTSYTSLINHLIDVIQDI